MPLTSSSSQSTKRGTCFPCKPWIMPALHLPVLMPIAIVSSFVSIHGSLSSTPRQTPLSCASVVPLSCWFTSLQSPGLPETNCLFSHAVLATTAYYLHHRIYGVLLHLVYDLFGRAVVSPSDDQSLDLAATAASFIIWKPIRPLPRTGTFIFSLESETHSKMNDTATRLLVWRSASTRTYSSCIL
jgi:hypothetical protein